MYLVSVTINSSSLYSKKISGMELEKESKEAIQTSKCIMNAAATKLQTIKVPATK